MASLIGLKRFVSFSRAIALVALGVAVWALYMPDIAPLNFRIIEVEKRIADMGNAMSTVQSVAENNRGILQDGFIAASGDTMPAITAAIPHLLASEQVLEKNLSSAIARMDKIDSLLIGNQKSIAKEIGTIRSRVAQIERNAIRAYAVALGDSSTDFAEIGWKAASSAKTTAQADSSMLNSGGWRSRVRMLNARMDSMAVRNARLISGVPATVADSLAKAAAKDLAKDLAKKAFASKTKLAKWQ